MVISSLQYVQGRARDVTWARSTSSECVRVREARRSHDGVNQRDRKTTRSTSSVGASHRRGIEGTRVWTCRVRCETSRRRRSRRDESRVVLRLLQDVFTREIRWSACLTGRRRRHMMHGYSDGRDYRVPRETARAAWRRNASSAGGKTRARARICVLSRVHYPDVCRVASLQRRRRRRVPDWD